MAQTKALTGEGIAVTVSPMTEPYWQATRERRLVAAKCTDCEHFRVPFLPFCPNCNAQEVEWVELTEPGTLYSFTFYPHPQRETADDQTMLAPAIVEFAQAPGVRYAGNLIDVDTADLAIGMRLETDWIFNGDGWGLPAFRPLA